MTSIYTSLYHICLNDNDQFYVSGLRNLICQSFLPIQLTAFLPKLDDRHCAIFLDSQDVTAYDTGVELSIVGIKILRANDLTLEQLLAIVQPSLFMLQDQRSRSIRDRNDKSLFRIFFSSRSRRNT